MADLTVIITSHNTARFIGPAIESVLAQSHAPDQVLVVDDSTDASSAVVAGYAQSNSARLRLLRVPPCNISQARNHGLNASTGRFVAFLDGDDVWLPDKTARQLELLEACPTAAGVWCRYFDFEQSLDDLGRVQRKTTADNPDVAGVLLRSDIPASCQLFRADALGSMRFDERSGHGEDVIFAADLRLAGPWRLVDAALVGKRLHRGQVTRNAWHQIWSAQMRTRWAREHADIIGPQAVAKVEQGIADGLCAHLEYLYWTRQVAALDRLRQAAAELFPQRMAASFLARRRIYPRWLYQLRDRLPV